MAKERECDRYPLRYGGPIVPERAGYTDSATLLEAWNGGRFARSWWIAGGIVSGQLLAKEGRGVWKNSDRLITEEPQKLFPALERAGVKHPSSFSDAFHQAAPYRPLIKRTWNGLYDFWRGGPWSEARKVGIFPGRWYRYDLRSAYRWAAYQGLPDPETWVARRRYVDGPGLWVGEFTGNVSGLPMCYREGGAQVVSSEDLELYRVPFKVWRGMTWERNIDPAYVERTLDKLPCGKESGRGFWGRWIARTAVKCRTANGESELKQGLFNNFPWGFLIMHRVRGRVWEAGADAAHVHVDEVVVPHEIDTGPDRLGAWREKEVFDRGIVVYRTGYWGCLGGKVAMQTGVKRDAA